MGDTSVPHYNLPPPPTPSLEGAIPTYVTTLDWCVPSLPTLVYTRVLLH